MDIGNCLQFLAIINKSGTVILLRAFLGVVSLAGQIYKYGFTE